MAADRYAVSVDISAKIEAWDKPSLVVVANDCLLYTSDAADE